MCEPNSIEKLPVPTHQPHARDLPEWRCVVSLPALNGGSSRCRRCFGPSVSPIIDTSYRGELSAATVPLFR